MTIADGLPYLIESAFHGAFLDPLERCGVLALPDAAGDVSDPRGAGYGSLFDADFAVIMRRLELDGWELASGDGEYWADGTPVEPLQLGERALGLVHGLDTTSPK